MNKYESIIIMSATSEEDKINEVIDKITNLIKENGNLGKTENLGKRNWLMKLKDKQKDYTMYLNLKVSLNL